MQTLDDCVVINLLICVFQAEVKRLKRKLQKDIRDFAFVDETDELARKASALDEFLCEGSDSDQTASVVKCAELLSTFDNFVEVQVPPPHLLTIHIVKVCLSVFLIRGSVQLQLHLISIQVM